MAVRTMHVSYLQRSSKGAARARTILLQRRGGCNNDFLQSLTPSGRCSWYLVTS